MELQVGVKALITDAQGRCLFLKRALPYANESEPRWDIPGGRINPGEPILEALAREVKEETGLTIAGEPKILYAQDILRTKGVHVVRLTFEVAVEPGEITIDADDPNGTHHDAFAWVPKHEIRNLHHDLYLAPVFRLVGIEPEA